nr:spidroin-1-like [Aegilops tauschii subsp. strangulata]
MAKRGGTGRQLRRPKTAQQLREHGEGSDPVSTAAGRAHTWDVGGCSSKQRQRRRQQAQLAGRERLQASADAGDDERVQWGEGARTSARCGWKGSAVRGRARGGEVVQPQQSAGAGDGNGQRGGEGGRGLTGVVGHGAVGRGEDDGDDGVGDGEAARRCGMVEAGFRATATWSSSVGGGEAWCRPSWEETRR